VRRSTPTISKFDNFRADPPELPGYFHVFISLEVLR